MSRFVDSDELHATNGRVTYSIQVVYQRVIPKSIAVCLSCFANVAWIVVDQLVQANVEWKLTTLQGNGNRQLERLYVHNRVDVLEDAILREHGEPGKSGRRSSESIDKELSNPTNAVRCCPSVCLTIPKYSIPCCQQKFPHTMPGRNSKRHKYVQRIYVFGSIRTSWVTALGIWTFLCKAK